MAYFITESLIRQEQMQLQMQMQKLGRTFGLTLASATASASTPASAPASTLSNSLVGYNHPQRRRPYPYDEGIVNTTGFAVDVVGNLAIGV